MDPGVVWRSQGLFFQRIQARSCWWWEFKRLPTGSREYLSAITRKAEMDCSQIILFAQNHPKPSIYTVHSPASNFNVNHVPWPSLIHRLFRKICPSLQRFWQMCSGAASQISSLQPVSQSGYTWIYLTYPDISYTETSFVLISSFLIVVKRWLAHFGAHLLLRPG